MATDELHVDETFKVTLGEVKDYIGGHAIEVANAHTNTQFARVVSVTEPTSISRDNTFMPWSPEALPDTDLNKVINPGFYRVAEDITNSPVAVGNDTDGAATLLVMPVNDTRVVQVYYHNDGRIWNRALQGTNWSAWQQLATEAQVATRVNRNGDTMTDRLFVRSASVGIGTAGGAGQLEVQNAEAGAAAVTFHRNGQFAVNFGLDNDNQLKVGGWSMGNIAHRIWHAGNFPIHHNVRTCEIGEVIFYHFNPPTPQPSSLIRGTHPVTGIQVWGWPGGSIGTGEFICPNNCNAYVMIWEDGNHWCTNCWAQAEEKHLPAVLLSHTYRITFTGRYVGLRVGETTTAIQRISSQNPSFTRTFTVPGIQSTTISVQAGSTDPGMIVLLRMG